MSIHEKIAEAAGIKDTAGATAVSLGLAGIMGVFTYLINRSHNKSERIRGYRKLVAKWRVKVTTLNIPSKDRMKLYKLLQRVLTENPSTKLKKKKLNPHSILEIKDILIKYPEIIKEFREDLAKV